MRRLGDYIRQVDVRNKDLAVTNLKGLSNEKVFIESIANTIGTDLSGYKIVVPRQFAYVPVTSRNGDKITIALYDEPNRAIVSQAYTVFEITDENVILPEYLMLWFRRPEFDRYARFKSNGSAREVFDWDEMCDVVIPVPPIEEQRAVVARHKAIEHKIDVNRRLIAALEETARTIYRHTFVDNIDPENLPHGWKMGNIGELFELQRGFDLPSQNRRNGLYPIYASNGIAEYHDEFKVKGPGVVTGRSGTIGEVFFVEQNFWPLNTALWIKDFKISNPVFAYYKLKELDLGKTVLGYATVPSLNRNDVHALECPIPPKELIETFQNKILPIISLKHKLVAEIAKLNSL